MKAAFAEEMREIDRKAFYEYGVPEAVLMENAGAAVAQHVRKMLGPAEGKKAAVFAGKGNNGGDAFVAARHLMNYGVKVKVYIIGDAGALQGSSKMNFEILKKMGIDILQVLSERDWDKVKIGLAFSDLAVDGLIGTGFHGGLSGEMARAVQMINDAQKPVVAVDVPSGVEADTGKALPVAVKAARTVTFGLPKIGLLLYPGAAYAGRVETAAIGLPAVLLENEDIKQNMVDDNTIRGLMVKRPADAHKGSCGRVLAIAGSRGLTGAACMVAEAAMRAGAGVVTLAIAESLHEIAENKLTEVMTYPLPEIEKGVIGESALPVLLELAQKYDVVEIGSGIGRNPETLKLIRSFIEKTDRQLVIDADAIHACAGMTDTLKNAKITPILTPHPGEMAALANRPVDQIQDGFVVVAREFAQKLNVIIVLKNARTVVAYPDGTVYINMKGNAGMATAGCGDVLAGVISGLFAQGLLSYSAAVAGVYLHSLAGDWTAKVGMVGLMASDIIKALPAARLQIEKQLKV